MLRLLVPAGLAFAALLSACVEIMPPPGLPTADDCGASGYQRLVGQDSTVLRRMQFGRPVRVIEPGMAVTMDYAAERLNFWIDKNGLIERVTCG